MSRRFRVEQFVAKLAVEAFAMAVLPWTARFDVSRPGARGFDPVAECLRHELGAIVGTDVMRDAAGHEQIAEGLDDLGPLSERATLMARPSRVNSSMMHSMRYALPSCVRSATKS